MILLIDNYDSFSYNLYHLAALMDRDIKVIRNDEMRTAEIERLNPKLIVISPGPGRPETSGVCVEAVRYFAGRIPIFGVCLGHQAICMAMGAKIGYAKRVMHGKTSEINISPDSIMFKGMGNKMQAARYHSLAALPSSMPEELKITAAAPDGEIMAVEHKKYLIFGVQFHPESVMTPQGKCIIKNITEAIK